MDQMTVQTSTRPSRRTTSKPSVRQSASKNDGKKIRRNGMVASTILLDPQTDDSLTDLAFALRKDRSELARDWIKERLARFDIAGKLMEVAERYKSDAGKSDDDSNRQSQATDSNGEKGEAA